MPKDFYSAIKDRRSYYGISKETTIPESRIEEIVSDAVLHSPSAFNSQSARAVVLLHSHHDQLWDIVMGTLRKKVPAEKFKTTEDKINSFKNGFGSILFFDDSSIVAELQQKFPSYRDNFPIWAQQANGMLQLVIWTGLESEGLGVSVQHYNPIIDDQVKERWNIPSTWQLIGQMPFGKPISDPGAKESLPVKDRIKVFKEQK